MSSRFGESTVALRVTASGGLLRTSLEVVGNVIRIGAHAGSEVCLPGLGERLLLLFASNQGVHGRRLDEANLRKRFDAATELRFTIGPYRIVARREELTKDRGPTRSSLLPTVVIEGRSRKEARLSRPITLIGRSELSDIALRRRGVSRVHAALLWDGEEVAVADLFSANGTQLDGSKIDYARLSIGQVLTVDDVTFHVRAPSVELASYVQPGATSAAAVTMTGSSVDAIAQDLSGDEQLETTAQPDEAATLHREAKHGRSPDVAKELELTTLDEQQPVRATEPSQDELTIDWEPVPNLERFGAVRSLPSEVAPAEESCSECGFEEVTAELNRLPHEEVFAEHFAGDESFTPIAQPDEAATLHGDASHHRSPEVADELELTTPDEQQPVSATEPSQDEPTIDWEPVADLEHFGAERLLPSEEATAEESRNERRREEFTADLNRLPHENVFAEHFAGDECFTPLTLTTLEAVSEPEAEPWGDLLVSDLRESAKLRVADTADALSGEFYDELPVFQGTRRKQHGANDPAADEPLANVADDLVLDNFITADDLRKNDLNSDDPPAPNLGAADLVDRDLHACETESIERKAPAAEAGGTVLSCADLGDANRIDADVGHDDLSDADLLNTELDRRNQRQSPQHILDFDFTETIEPGELAPREAALTDKASAVIDQEHSGHGLRTFLTTIWASLPRALTPRLASMKPLNEQTQK